MIMVFDNYFFIINLRRLFDDQQLRLTTLFNRWSPQKSPQFHFSFSLKKNLYPRPWAVVSQLDLDSPKPAHRFQRSFVRSALRFALPFAAQCLRFAALFAHLSLQKILSKRSALNAARQYSFAQ